MSRSGNGISRYSHLPLCLYLLTTSSLLADVIPGRWEKLEAQPLGLEIVVVLQGGQRVEAEFRGLSPDHLAIEIGSGEERQLLTQEILRVQGPVESYRNSGRYGLVIGLRWGFRLAQQRCWGRMIWLVRRSSWSYCQKLWMEHQAAISSSRTPLMNVTFSMTSPRRR